MYLVDCFNFYLVFVFVVNIMVWFIVGVVFLFVVLFMYDKLGLGWGNSLFGFIVVFFILVLWFILWYGEFLWKKYEIKNLWGGIRVLIERGKKIS